MPVNVWDINALESKVTEAETAVFKIARLLGRDAPDGSKVPAENRNCWGTCMVNLFQLANVARRMAETIEARLG